MTHNLDAAPADTLDVVFDGTNAFTGTTWEPMFMEIVRRLRSEADGLPMNTAQILLIERMATFYVMQRQREAEADAPLTANAQKGATDAWLSMTQEFNKQLNSGADKLRDKTLGDVQMMIASLLPTISDPEEQKAFRRRLAEEFARMGM